MTSHRTNTTGQLRPMVERFSGYHMVKRRRRIAIRRRLSEGMRESRYIHISREREQSVFRRMQRLFGRG
jgi:hypothetical protein